MNIFILDSDIAECAKAHVDRHVIKMILESAQLLCTAINYYANEQKAPYKSTHINHPCSIWVRESFDNFYYLTRLMNKLNHEYIYRFDKTNNHKSVNVLSDANILKLAKHYYPEELHNIGLTSFALCMPEDFKIKDNAVQSYRNYYNGVKQHLHRWTKREPPEWILDIQTKV